LKLEKFLISLRSIALPKKLGLL